MDFLWCGWKTVSSFQALILKNKVMMKDRDLKRKRGWCLMDKIHPFLRVLLWDLKEQLIKKYVLQKNPACANHFWLFVTVIVFWQGLWELVYRSYVGYTAKIQFQKVPCAIHHGHVLGGDSSKTSADLHAHLPSSYQWAAFGPGFRDSGRISRTFIVREKKASSSWSFHRTLARPQQICFYRLMLGFHFVISGYLHGAPKLKPEKLHLLKKKKEISLKFLRFFFFFFFFLILMSLHYTWMDTSADDPSVFQIQKVTSKYVIKSSKNISKNNICNYFQRKVKKRTQVGFNDPFSGYCLLDLLDVLVIMAEMFFIEETEWKVFLDFRKQLDTLIGVSESGFRGHRWRAEMIYETLLMLWLVS